MYQDGLQILSGAIVGTTGNIMIPTLAWGDLTLSSFGVSEWEYVWHNASTVSCGGAVGVPWGTLVDASALRQISLTPWPNPSRGSPTFAIHSSSMRRDVDRLKVFDVTGRLVRSLVVGPLLPGLTNVRWDGKDGAGRAVSSGTYFVRLEAVRRSTRIEQGDGPSVT